MRTLPSCLTLVILATFIGCSEQPASTTAGSSDSNAQAEFVPIRPTKPYETPEATVADFLVAVKAGDDNAATSLLSTASQRDAWSNGMGITTEGFPNSDFQIADVEYLEGNQEAHVMCRGSDVSIYDGTPASFDCVWLLRREPHGWSIYGMGSQVEGINVLLNFENQAEMQQTLAKAEQMIQQRQLTAQQQQITPVAGPVAGSPPQQPARQGYPQQATRPATTAR